MAAKKKADNPAFTGRNVALTEIAQTSGISVAALKQGLREGALDFGYAIPCGEGKMYRYYCPDKQVWEKLGDRIDRKTLDTVFSSFDELQEEYHNKLYELLREVKNHG